MAAATLCPATRNTVRIARNQTKQYTYMKTVSIQLYTINELPTEKAKEKARNWWRECQDSSWSDFTIEEAVTQGELLGIAFKQRNVRTIGGKTYGEPCIRWSGFSSQGDGACFEGIWRAKDVKVDKVAEGWGEDPSTSEIKSIAEGFATIAQTWPFAYTHVTHSSRYCHERSVSFDTGFGDEYPDDLDGIDDKWATAADDIEDACRAFMRWIYRSLEKEHDYQNSDEFIDEVMEMNEYSFLSDGTRFEA
jgi:hypothetical protein